LLLRVLLLPDPHHVLQLLPQERRQRLEHLREVGLGHHVLEERHRDDVLGLVDALGELVLGAQYRRA